MGFGLVCVVGLFWLDKPLLVRLVLGFGLVGRDSCWFGLCLRLVCGWFLFFLDEPLVGLVFVCGWFLFAFGLVWCGKRCWGSN